jgi:superfamily II DNA or RNA helicase
MSKTKQKSVESYHQRYREVLHSQIQKYKLACSEISLFNAGDFSIFNSVRAGITSYPLREYQMEALYVLDYLLKCSPKEPHKKHLLEEVDDVAKTLSPFLSFEMATGSGKTMLMGASIYLLNQKFGIKNFLIITPASTDIYAKTIRNFQSSGSDSIWASNGPFRFNLITGDNYADNLFYREDVDANIFVFNISKFGKNAVNTQKTWESAVWKDDAGNSISVKTFLKGKKLAIITDEAHHAQTPSAKRIISEFHPDLVLEYTATAVEQERSAAKKNQQVVYKYDIRRFLEEGYGKLVRAVAIGDGAKSKDIVSQHEKLKLITFFLIHLLKKEALLKDVKCKGVKPLGFIKVKEDTKATQRIFEYIKNELHNDDENIKLIVGKLRSQELEITKLLTDMLLVKFGDNIDALRTRLQTVTQQTIFYHGASDAETNKRFVNIRRNEVEVVVYMQKLDEGIDLPNIYTMAVIADTESNFKTSVKQIIGRGVRLPKDRREFDDSEDVLLQQVEKLHVVCDQGKNFEEVITSIQQEFGLNSKYLSFDKVKEKTTNASKTELLRGKYLPHIKADFKVKDGADLFSIIGDAKTVVERYIEHNCFRASEEESQPFLKFKPDSFFVEVDIFASQREYHKQLQETGGKAESLRLTNSHAEKIYGLAQRFLFCLPDTSAVKECFQRYCDAINNVGLQFYSLDDGDRRLAENLLISTFGQFYRSYVEKHYFKLDFQALSELESWNLASHFKDYQIVIPKDQVRNKTLGKSLPKEEVSDLIGAGYHFFGFDKSIYDYDCFDSYPEFQLATYVDSSEGYSNRSEFWIRNRRNIHFTYGSRRYFPDFIVFKDKKLYVIETKGEIYSDSQKNALLDRLNEVPGDANVEGYRGVLVYSTHIEEVLKNADGLEALAEVASHIAKKVLSTSRLVPSPPEAERFVSYVPAFSASSAYKRFIKGLTAIRPDGWLEVQKSEAGYPVNVFASQVKGAALSPEHPHDSWLLFKKPESVVEGLNQVCLVHAKRIDDDYEKGFVIRRLEVSEIRTSTSLFPVQQIVLASTNGEHSSIILESTGVEQEVEIVGVLYSHEVEGN